MHEAVVTRILDVIEVEDHVSLCLIGDGMANRRLFRNVQPE
jgi:hypothetical protein